MSMVLNSDTPYCSGIFQPQDELLAWAEKECLRNLAAQGC